MNTTKAFLFTICSFLLFSCEQETIYQYELVKEELKPFLQPELADVFQYSDTLIIYDTTYFNRAISTLNEYKNHLEAKDSFYNTLIVNRLQELEISKRQINHPNIYLSNKGIKANFESEQQDIEKIMRFFAAYPEQLEAAKSQLIRPDMAHTKFAINELTALFTFISNDLNDHLKTTNTYEKYQSTYINTQLAIKDYIAFLNSKLLNEEVD
jgi:hypothetical protein